MAPSGYQSKHVQSPDLLQCVSAAGRDLVAQHGTDLGLLVGLFEYVIDDRQLHARFEPASSRVLQHDLPAMRLDDGRNTLPSASGGMPRPRSRTVTMKEHLSRRSSIFGGVAYLIAFSTRLLKARFKANGRPRYTACAGPS